MLYRLQEPILRLQILHLQRKCVYFYKIGDFTECTISFSWIRSRWNWSWRNPEIKVGQISFRIVTCPGAEAGSVPEVCGSSLASIDGLDILMGLSISKFRKNWLMLLFDWTNDLNCEQGDQMFLRKNRPMTTKDRLKSRPTIFLLNKMRRNCLLVFYVCFMIITNCNIPTF
jgi:hypothetical protein